MPRANSPACESLNPVSGSTKTLMIFSGVSCATCSMSMPPSELPISTTVCVARSVSTAT